MQEVDLIAVAAGGKLPSAVEAEARRVMEVCNACRYCEGFCAVFPAMTLQREFSSGDLTYLANLCHGCRGCYYACQYAPPHEFGINAPKAFAELRHESYARYAWPRALAAAFETNGVAISLTMTVGIILVFIATIAFQDPERLFGVHRNTPGAGFYAIVPHGPMVIVGSATFLFSLWAITVGFLRFWKAIRDEARLLDPVPLWQALVDAATLRYLDGGGDGCNDTDGRFTGSRRMMHHSLAYGFLLCFAATVTGTIYDYVFGWLAPYPLLSLPVILGSLGGVGMSIGGIGLLWLKMKGDREPQSRKSLGADTGLLLLLTLIAMSGMLLLGLRTTSAMGVTLIVHLGLVFSFFLTMPYTKFIHGLYRLAALIRFARDQPKPRPEAKTGSNPSCPIPIP